MAVKWLRVFWIVVFGMAVVSAAQTSPDCLPFPSFQYELRHLLRDQHCPEVRISRVRFRSHPELSRDIRKQITASLKERTFGDADWVGEAEEITREMLQKHGYFKARVVGQPHTVGVSFPEEIATITFLVDEGLQYRLAGIFVAQARTFSLAQLRQLFQPRDGEIFDAEQIRSGLDAMRKLYNSSGFIDFTAVPQFQTNEQQATISVLIDVDEGKQFRLGKILVLGVDDRARDSVLQQCHIASGAVFTAKLLDCFYNKTGLLLDATAAFNLDSRIAKNDQQGTIDIVFDLRPRAAETN